MIPRTAANLQQNHCFSLPSPLITGPLFAFALKTTFFKGCRTWYVPTHQVVELHFIISRMCFVLLCYNLQLIVVIIMRDFAFQSSPKCLSFSLTLFQLFTIVTNNRLGHKKVIFCHNWCCILWDEACFHSASGKFSPVVILDLHKGSHEASILSQRRQRGKREGRASQLPALGMQGVDKQSNPDRLCLHSLFSNRPTQSHQWGTAHAHIQYTLLLTRTLART